MLARLERREAAALSFTFYNLRPEPYIYFYSNIPRDFHLPKFDGQFGANI
jgi:hypothetical protein